MVMNWFTKSTLPKEAKIQKLQGDLLHFTYKDIHHYLVKSASYAKAWAIQRANAGKTASLFDGVTHAIGCFVKMYLLKAGFRWQARIFIGSSFGTFYFRKICGFVESYSEMMLFSTLSL